MGSPEKPMSSTASEVMEYVFLVDRCSCEDEDCPNASISQLFSNGKSVEMCRAISMEEAIYIAAYLTHKRAQEVPEGVTRQ